MNRPDVTTTPGVALTVIPPTCQHCATPLVTITPATQLPLLRHAGYGAATTTTWQQCPRCGTRRHTTTTTDNPRRPR